MELDGLGPCNRLAWFGLSPWLVRLKLLCCLVGALRETWCVWTLIYSNFYASYFLPLASFEKASAFVLAGLAFVICLSKTWPFFLLFTWSHLFTLLCLQRTWLHFPLVHLVSSGETFMFIHQDIGGVFIALNLMVGESSRFYHFFICGSWHFASFLPWEGWGVHFFILA